MNRRLRTVFGLLVAALLGLVVVNRRRKAEPQSIGHHAPPSLARAGAGLLLAAACPL